VKTAPSKSQIIQNETAEYNKNNYSVVLTTLSTNDFESSIYISPSDENKNSKLGFLKQQPNGNA
jgi:hypothetical protein